jgi:GNAT superfamily N-acetyltransferase
VKLKIRLAKQGDLKDILNVLNAAVLALHEKGISQWEYPWDEKELVDQMEFLYVVTVNNQVMGTFGIKDIDCLNEYLVESSSKYLYQIAILPEYQGKGYGPAITSWAREYANGMGKPLYLDCWAGNEKLKSFYQENGFDYVGDFPEENYYISVFKCAQEG